MQFLKRSGLFCAVLAGALVSSAAAREECAPYISGPGSGDPLNGYLLGSETRTFSFHVGTKVEPGGIGGSMGGTYTIQWEVGYYRMSDGTTLAIDCRFYRLA